MIDKANINKRLALVKYLHSLGADALNSGSSINKATCVLHFHDAVEMLFILIAEHLKVTKRNLELMEYFEAIKQADKEGRGIRNRKIIDKLRLLRVAFKHHGIAPNEDECIAIKVGLDDFFDEVTTEFFNINYSSISLAESIEDESVRHAVHDAEKYLKSEDYENCLSKLGMAFYLLFENNKDKTRQSFGNAIFLPTEPNLFGVIPRDFEGIMESYSNKTYTPLAEVLNILVTGIDYQKYSKFRCLTPTFTRFLNGKIRETGKVSEFKSRFNINKQNSEFCYHFVIDTALRIEKFNFGLVSIWDKPDKVTITTRDIDLYKGDRSNLKKIGVIPKDTIIKFGPSAIVVGSQDYRDVEFNNCHGLIEYPAATKEIDNPELSVAK